MQEWDTTTTSGRPLILVVTQHPEKYAGLPAVLDFAANATAAKTNLYGAQLLGERYALVLADVLVDDASELHIVQSLRRSMLYDGDIYLVKDNVGASDVEQGRQAGAAGVTNFKFHSLTALLSARPAPAAAPFAPQPGRMQSATPADARVAPPPYLKAVTRAMREFLASEAEPRVLALYERMNRRRPQVAISFDEMVDEAAAQLLDDPDDQQTFVKFANSLKGTVR